MTAWSRGRSETVVEASLGHGDPVATEGAWLHVTVTSIDTEVGRTLATIRHRLAADPRGTVMNSGGIPAAERGDPDTGPAGGAGIGPGAPDWSPVTLTVAGRPTVFDWLALGRHWVAVAEVGSEVVSLRSRDLPVAEVELVPVTDFEPYIAGQRQLRPPDLK
jgi:hypothetical protein